MKRTLAILAAAFLMLAVQHGVVQGAKKECDVARIEDAPECPKCSRILEQEDMDKDGKCKKCDEKPNTVKVCVKVGYVCKEDGTESFEPGKCLKCEKELSKITVRSRVMYKCPECGSTSEKAGDCDICEKPRQETCRHSGTFPHVVEE